MPDDGDTPNLEERRLALEELKAQHEFELRARELARIRGFACG